MSVVLLFGCALFGIQATAAEPSKSYVETIPGTAVTFRMISIPGGEFTMGSPADEAGRNEDEGPQVRVRIEPFYMAEHEVTWPEFEAFTDNYHLFAQRQAAPISQDKFADAVTYPTPMYRLEADPILARMGGQLPNRPAVSMSHFAALQYCKWLSKKTGRFYRLPTEAEWEYACRAGTTTAYSFGEDPKKLDDHGWHFDNSEYKETGENGYHPVGAKHANAWGLYDMHGNVAEWCFDQYDKDWYAKLAAKGGIASGAEAICWPEGKSRYPRVIRGGHYESEAVGCRSAIRQGSHPRMNEHDVMLPKSAYWEASAFWVGFRVVAPVRRPDEAERRRFWNADDQETQDTIHQDRDRHELIESPSPSID